MPFRRLYCNKHNSVILRRYRIRMASFQGEDTELCAIEEIEVDQLFYSQRASNHVSAAAGPWFVCCRRFSVARCARPMNSWPFRWSNGRRGIKEPRQWGCIRPIIGASGVWKNTKAGLGNQFMSSAGWWPMRGFATWGPMPSTLTPSTTVRALR